MINTSLPVPNALSINCIKAVPSTYSEAFLVAPDSDNWLTNLCALGPPIKIDGF